MIEDVQPRERKPNAGGEATGEHSLVFASAGRGAFSVTFRGEVIVEAPAATISMVCEFLDSEV